MNTEIQKNNPLGTEPINSLLAKFAIPSIIAMLVSALYNIVDQFFIGRSVGMLGNAATNVAFPLTIICTAISLLCGIGGAANFNLAMGAGEEKRARTCVGNVVNMMLSLGILLCLITQLFLEPMMHAFGATSDILGYALSYTGITSWGFPFLILTTAGSHLIRADGSPRFSMLCTLTGAIINTILDPLFIFGFQLGMQGAAYATVIGQIISAVMVIAYLTHFKTVKLSLSDLRPDFSCWLKILSLGMTPCLNQLAMMIVQIVMNNTLTYYGRSSVYGSEVPLACAGIISKVSMIFFSLVIGTSQGLQPLVSFNYGAGKYARVRESFRKAAMVCLIISVLAFVCFQAFPRQIIRIFGSGTEEYYHFAEQYFRIYLFFTFANFLQPLAANFFTSIGKPIRGVFLSLTRQIIFLLPLLIILPLFMGIDGVMYSAPIADFIAAVLSALFVLMEMNTLKKHEAVKPAV